MHKPKLLLLDEPTAGVDPKARREFWDEIHDLAADGMTVMVSTHYMDEAERCHRINYIAYGKLLTSGTVEQVVREAGLHTFILSGQDALQAARILQKMEGVDQITPFGNKLHVVGKNKDLLKQAVDQTASKFGVTCEPGQTTLEDVFIQYMTNSTDNMAETEKRMS